MKKSELFRIILMNRKFKSTALVFSIYCPFHTWWIKVFISYKKNPDANILNGSYNTIHFNVIHLFVIDQLENQYFYKSFLYS